MDSISPPREIDVTHYPVNKWDYVKNVLANDNFLNQRHFSKYIQITGYGLNQIISDYSFVPKSPQKVKILNKKIIFQNVKVDQ